MSRTGMQRPLVVTAVVALVVLIASSIVGWQALGGLADQSDVSDDTSIPATALALSQHSHSLASVALVTTSLAMDRDSVLAIRSSIGAEKAELRDRLSELSGRGYDARVSRIEGHVNSLISIVDQVDSARPALLRALADGEIKRRALSNATTRELVPVAVKSEDDQYYYMMTGRSETRGTTGGGEALSRDEFLRYKHMSGLLRAVGVAHSSLSAAFRVQDPTLVTTLEEAFDSASQRARAALEYLAVNGGPELDPQLIPLATRLIDAGTGPGNEFDQVKTRLSMALVEQRLISSSHQVLATLEAEIAGVGGGREPQHRLRGRAIGAGRRGRADDRVGRRSHRDPRNRPGRRVLGFQGSGKRRDSHPGGSGRQGGTVLGRRWSRKSEPYPWEQVRRFYSVTPPARSMACSSELASADLRGA